MLATWHEFVGADEPFDDLYAMPHPSDAIPGYVIVGYTGLVPEEPWPGQVHYERVRGFEDDGPDGPLAFYTLDTVV